jgi:DNA-binding Lrp family transcriptional regulator
VGIVLSDRKRANLRDIEVKVLAELIKNSRRSDRDIAKSVGTSQPTVSRIIKKLEKEGIIKEYTIIPNFKKLGYQIMAFLFMGKQETMDKRKSEELRKAVAEMENKTPIATLTVADGIGLAKGRVIVILFKDYSSYVEKLDIIRNLPNVEAENMESFLVDLNDERNFRILSMKQVAHHFEAYQRRAQS